MIPLRGWGVPFLAACFLIALGTRGHAETGIASHYHEGKWTANGERFKPDGMTCAHRRYLFGSILRVTLRERAVECRVNDRGPWIKGRIIDLSRGSARALGLHGIARVTVEHIR
jgi:rare lipoprotein A